MYIRKERSDFLRVFLISILGSLVTGVVLFYLISGYMAQKFTSPQKPLPVPEANVNPSAPAPQQLAADGTVSNIAVNIAVNIAKSATPSVVGISVLQANGNNIFDKNTAEKWGFGSGIIVNPNGYILTNDHVAGGKNKKMIVSLSDGRTADGTTLWTDPVIDMAVVKISLTGLPALPLGDAGALQVGEQVIAIGNPLGLQFQRSVTSGIVSALNRTIKIDTPSGANFMEDLIQTDASINPGNSGGPLVNSRGQVIGINTVKVASAEAMGFAIPINLAEPIVRNFAEKGAFNEPYLGVFAYDKEVAPYVNPNLKIDRGVYINNIDATGPAAKGGCKVGDTIMEIDAKEVNTMLELRTLIYNKNVGDTVLLTCADNTGKTRFSQVKLISKPKSGLITR